MKYKMLVTDFDNTLLRTDHTIAPETLRAIREYEARGGKFVIATGRMLSAIISAVRPLGFSGEIIAFQGGVVAEIESGKEIFKRYIPYKVAAELLGDIEKKGYYIQIYHDGKYFANRYVKRTKIYADTNRLEPAGIVSSPSEYVLKNKVNPDKILFALEDDCTSTYGEVKEVIAEYCAKYGTNLLFNSSNIMIIEAIERTADKGFAVEFLAKKYGIKREEVVCMGDSLNDAPMVAWAGLGVAVSNATDDLKEVADVVTVSCDEDAVGETIRTYCLV